MKTINPDSQVGILLPKGVEGTWRAVKASKKSKKPDQQTSVPEQIEKAVTKPVHEKVEKEVSRELVLTKTCITKRTKKPAHRPRHSPEAPIIDDVPVEPLSLPKEVFRSKGIKNIRKPKLNRSDVSIRDVQIPISPDSNKCKAHEVVRKIEKKKIQLADPLDEVVVETNFDSGSEHTPIRYEES